MMRRSLGLYNAVFVLAYALAIALSSEESRSATAYLEVPVASAVVADDPVVLIFPQIADGGGNRTQLLLTNASETATTATITFYSDTGTPLNLTINGSNSSSFQVFLPAHGSTKVTTTGAAESALIGWAKVTANPTVDLSGNAVFQYYRGPDLYAEASIPGILPISSMDFLPMRRTDSEPALRLPTPERAPRRERLLCAGVMGQSSGPAVSPYLPGVTWLHFSGRSLARIFHRAVPTSG